MAEPEAIADVFKALSDPTRLRLIALLQECSTANASARRCGNEKSQCVNALAYQLGITQSAASQHLRVLRQVGLVRGDRHGSFVHYSLDPTGVARCSAALRETLGDAFTEG